MWSIIMARSPPSAMDTPVMSPKVSGIFTSLLVVYTVCLFCTFLFHRLLFMYRRRCSWPIRDNQHAYRLGQFVPILAQQSTVWFILLNLPETQSFRGAEIPNNTPKKQAATEAPDRVDSPKTPTCGQTVKGSLTPQQKTTRQQTQSLHLDPQGRSVHKSSRQQRNRHRHWIIKPFKPKMSC
ncbi:MAG: hypothetical protein J3Q66DRAFT_358595 [Benniella sp.]|nr:MAG: hypothetical protein J3Q66DRAFT_358595 [Benniella sp.]